jgi:hypothetical protein
MSGVVCLVGQNGDDFHLGCSHLGFSHLGVSQSVEFLSQLVFDLSFLVLLTLSHLLYSSYVFGRL